MDPRVSISSGQHPEDWNFLLHQRGAPYSPEFRNEVFVVLELLVFLTSTLKQIGRQNG